MGNPHGIVALGGLWKLLVVHINVVIRVGPVLEHRGEGVVVALVPVVPSSAIRAKCLPRLLAAALNLGDGLAMYGSGRSQASTRKGKIQMWQELGFTPSNNGTQQTFHLCRYPPPVYPHCRRESGARAGRGGDAGRLRVLKTHDACREAEAMPRGGHRSHSHCHGVDLEYVGGTCCARSSKARSHGLAGNTTDNEENAVGMHAQT